MDKDSLNSINETLLDIYYLFITIEPEAEAWFERESPRYEHSAAIKIKWRGLTKEFSFEEFAKSLGFPSTSKET